ncbi:MAG: bifunctional phosphoribosyl-AMP cyclohydrolase/phosphoribosyl-ATP diphosphatase HisIE [Bacillota bacterium]
MSWVDEVKFDNNGLVPVVVQEGSTGQVLMLAYANARALELTRTSGQAWYWSRQRGRLWRKGETSGNTQEVVGITLDCDRDAIVYRVVQSGDACHEGVHSCFHNVVLDDPSAGVPGERGQQRAGTRATEVLARVTTVIEKRKREMPPGSYVAGLVRQGLPAIARKVGEEAAEFLVALLAEGRERAVSEFADVLFHSIVALGEVGAGIDDVLFELEKRER